MYSIPIIFIMSFIFIDNLLNLEILDDLTDLSDLDNSYNSIDLDNSIIYFGDFLIDF